MESRKLAKIDSNGGYFQKEIGRDFYFLTLKRIHGTIHNMLLYDVRFAESTQIIYISFLEVLSISTPKHEKSYHSDLWLQLVLYTLVFLKDSELKDCLDTYKNKSNLISSSDNLKSISGLILEILENIKSGKENIVSYYRTKQKNSFSFEENLNHVIRNICIYLKTLNFDEEDLNIMLSIILDIFETPGIIWPSTNINVIDLIKKRQGLLSRENCDRIIIGYQSNPILYMDFDFYDKNFLDLKDFDYQRSENETLFNIWVYRKNDVDISKISNAFRSNLDKNFDLDELRLGVITDLISFSDYEEQALFSIKERLKLKYDLFDKEWVVKSFLEIAYHVNLDLALQKYQELIPQNTKEREYYLWLFNLETYDYSKFNPYWLLKYPYSVFFNKFKTIQKIKEHTKEYLKKHEDGKIAHIYFAHFFE